MLQNRKMTSQGRPSKSCTLEQAYLPRLPIEKCKQKLIKVARDTSFFIVTGDTGSGKTTQLPQYLYKAGKCLLGVIVLCMPIISYSCTVVLIILYKSIISEIYNFACITLVS